MSLVQYSDSDSDASPSASPPPSKKPRPNPIPKQTQPPSGLPPLPASFHDLYASSTRVSVKDDPALHGGRKRVIPHVEGNWPTHLYLEWYPAKQELALLADLIARCRDDHEEEEEEGQQGPGIQSLLHSDLGAQLPLHISLSRPVVLRTEQRALFTETLTKAIQTSHLSPFTVRPDTLKWVSNYEKTRWFLVLHVAKPQNNGLNRLLELCNRALAQFNQPPLYATSSRESRPSRAKVAHDHDHHSQCGDYSDCFHISLAWSLNEPGARDEDLVKGMDLRAVKDLSVRFDSVKAKIGNHVESILLPAAS